MQRLNTYPKHTAKYWLKQSSVTTETVFEHLKLDCFQRNAFVIEQIVTLEGLKHTDT